MPTFRKNACYAAFMGLMLVSCSPAPRELRQATSTALPVDSSYDQVSDSTYIRVLEPIKADLDKKMSALIGFAAGPLTVDKPESTLSNWASDVLRNAAKPYCNERQADVAIVNLGGLRCDIPAGPILLRQIYELMPFDNKLVILTLKGADILELCNLFAQAGGEGISGIRMTINGGKAQHVTIDGRNINPEQEYTIATSDYLAGGNDNMMPLANYTSRIETGMTIRDIFIDFIRHETGAGRPIAASVDGRTTIIQ